MFFKFITALHALYVKRTVVARPAPNSVTSYPLCWDTGRAVRTPRVVECQTTGIHSVRHQLLQDQAVQHGVSELTSSVAVSLAAEVQRVQMQGLRMAMMTSSNTSPEICLGKNSYNM